MDRLSERYEHLHHLICMILCLYLLLSKLLLSCFVLIHALVMLGIACPTVISDAVSLQSQASSGIFPQASSVDPTIEHDSKPRALQFARLQKRALRL